MHVETNVRCKTTVRLWSDRKRCTLVKGINSLIYRCYIEETSVYNAHLSLVTVDSSLQFSSLDRLSRELKASWSNKVFVSCFLTNRCFYFHYALFHRVLQHVRHPHLPRPCTERTIYVMVVTNKSSSMWPAAYMLLDRVKAQYNTQYCATLLERPCVRASALCACASEVCIYVGKCQPGWGFFFRFGLAILWC